MRTVTSASLGKELAEARKSIKAHEPAVKQAYEDRVVYETKRNIERSFPMSNSRRLMSSAAFAGRV